MYACSPVARTCSISPGLRAEADAVQDVDNGLVIIRDGGGRHRGALLVGSKESRDRNSGGERCLEKA